LTDIQKLRTSEASTVGSSQQTSDQCILGDRSSDITTETIPPYFSHQSHCFSTNDPKIKLDIERVTDQSTTSLASEVGDQQQSAAYSLYNSRKRFLTSFRSPVCQTNVVIKRIRKESLRSVDEDTTAKVTEIQESVASSSGVKDRSVATGFWSFSKSFQTLPIGSSVLSKRKSEQNRDVETKWLSFPFLSTQVDRAQKEDELVKAGARSRFNFQETSNCSSFEESRAGYEKSKLTKQSVLGEGQSHERSEEDKTRGRNLLRKSFQSYITRPGWVVSSDDDSEVETETSNRTRFIKTGLNRNTGSCTSSRLEFYLSLILSCS